MKPTLKDAVAGDITAAMPYRAMTNIIEFIKMLDMVCLLYTSDLPAEIRLNRCRAYGVVYYYRSGEKRPEDD